MSTRGHKIEVGGVPVEIVRKDIKNLHLGVYPPNGRVRVAAPLRLTDEAVRLAVVARLGWVRRRQAGFDQQDRQSEREMVSGESHYVQGRRYRLNVVEESVAPTIATRKNTTLEISVPPGTDRRDREEALQQWYRQRLRSQLPELIAKWEPVVRVKVADCRIRRMKTRWGSSNATARRVWVNLELAKKPLSCLEYILVHEMVHLLERHHNDRFRELMDTVMPQWRVYRDELNRAPLSHESWSY
ncbi:MAG: M48 family metallopeptidase [Acidobacteria bacterium]|nr:M48 family metallopeptidase [Acidobacteriota bacterium]